MTALAVNEKPRLASSMAKPGVAEFLDGGSLNALVPLAAVLCTEEFARRAVRPPDHETESRALALLVQALADSPRTILQTLADTILTLFKVGSAGVSLLTADEKYLVWPAISGAWKANTGGSTQRDFSPCGYVLDCDAPLLFRRFERRYTAFAQVTPPAEECVLIPFHVKGKAVGTIWAIAHDKRRKFDAEDLRQLQALGRFASAAYQAGQDLDTARTLMEEAMQSRQAMETLNAELRQSEEFNRSIVNSSPDCIKVLDLEGNLLSMPAGRELLGIEDIQPFLNKSWIDFWTGENRLAARAAVKRAADDGEGRFDGFCAIGRAEARWWDVTISPIRGADGKAERLLAVSRDVTQRKIDEKVLRQSEERFRALVMASSDLMCRMSPDWREMRQIYDKHRVTDIAVANSNWLELYVHRDDQPRLMALVKEAIRTKSLFEMEHRVRRADGSWGWLLSRAVPLLDAEGEIVEWFGTGTDVTEQKRAEQALRDSGERFRALFDHGPIAMYSCDASGTIQEFNRNAALLWGRKPVRGDSSERFCGAFKLLFPDGSPMPHAHSSIAAVLKGEVPIALGVEVLIERADGTRTTILANIVPLKNDRGEITGAINCMYDITERSRLQRKTVEQAQKLVELDRRKDEFLAMLSHELRNPLAPLSNAVQLLRLHKNDDPVQQQAHGIIERQVGQLKHLVDDLLEVSRITTGSVRLRQDQISLSDVVERAVETAQPLIRQHRHELAVALPRQEIFLHADAARLEQVLVNLLTNAAKYTDDGGRIWLSVEQEGDAGGAVAVVRVRDTGIGIDAGLMPRIFDLFTQADRSLDRSQGGLGIGLSLVQRLVELHGGTVKAYSTPGQGSEFVVRLPVMLTALPPSPAHPVAPPSATSRKVLVVDDNVDAVQSLANLLKMFGHEVQIAYDGQSGLEAAQATRPDVVLLDIGLPGLAGFEVAEQIRQLPVLDGTVLVALTGYGRDADRQLSHDAGFDHHLVKPADFAAVQTILASIGVRSL